MKSTVKIATAVLIGSSLVGVAQGQELSCVKDVVYSQELLAKYPEIGKGCQEVKVVQGEKWVRFDAQVKSNQNNQISVDFLNTAGEHTATPMTFEYPPDANLTLTNGTVKAASAIKKGDKLTVWMPESRFGFYAAPGAAEQSKFRLASGASTEQR